MTVQRPVAPPIEVITLGECLVSLVAADHGPLAGVDTFQSYVAGAEANVAVGLARLGRRVAYVGRVGADGFGTRILRTLRGEGVDVAGVAVDPDARTGLMFRERRALGPAEVFYARAGSAGSRLGPEDVRAAEARGVAEGARWLHLSGITPALSLTCRAAVWSAVELARANDLTISLDINLRRRLWSEAEAATVLAELAGRVDVVIADEDEATVVTGAGAGLAPEALAASLLALGPRLVVIKLGALGALALAHGEGLIRSLGLAVPNVVDPVGAGDAFCAGLVDARLEGLDLQAALARANACGAAALAAVGDVPGLPTRIELERLLQHGGPDTIR